MFFVANLTLLSLCEQSALLGNAFGFQQPLLPLSNLRSIARGAVQLFSLQHLLLSLYSSLIFRGIAAALFNLSSAQTSGGGSVLHILCALDLVSHH